MIFNVEGNNFEYLRPTKQALKERLKRKVHFMTRSWN